MSTIPVYVQTTEDSMGFFADWPIEDLNDVIAVLGEWGLTDSTGNDTDAQRTAVGEFLHNGKRIVFRVTVDD